MGTYSSTQVVNPTGDVPVHIHSNGTTSWAHLRIASDSENLVTISGLRNELPAVLREWAAKIEAADDAL